MMCVALISQSAAWDRSLPDLLPARLRTIVETSAVTVVDSSNVDDAPRPAR